MKKKREKQGQKGEKGRKKGEKGKKREQGEEKAQGRERGGFRQKGRRRNNDTKAIGHSNEARQYNKKRHRGRKEKWKEWDNTQRKSIKNFFTRVHKYIIYITKRPWAGLCPLHLHGTSKEKAQYFGNIKKKA